MKPIERAFKRIWDTSKPLPEAYTNRHQNLTGLLQDKHNLLGNANQFPEEPVGWNKAQFIHDVETNGLFSMHELNIQSVKDWFLMVELAKTFPFIKELSLNDQVWFDSMPNTYVCVSDLPTKPYLFTGTFDDEFILFICQQCKKRNKKKWT
jgi:hypothetical protein